MVYEIVCMGKQYYTDYSFRILLRPSLAAIQPHMMSWGAQSADEIIAYLHWFIPNGFKRGVLVQGFSLVVNFKSHYLHEDQCLQLLMVNRLCVPQKSIHVHPWCLDHTFPPAPASPWYDQYCIVCLDSCSHHSPGNFLHACYDELTAPHLHCSACV